MSALLIDCDSTQDDDDNDTVFLKFCLVISKCIQYQLVFFERTCGYTEKKNVYKFWFQKSTQVTFDIKENISVNLSILPTVELGTRCLEFQEDLDKASKRTECLSTVCHCNNLLFKKAEILSPKKRSTREKGKFLGKQMQYRGQIEEAF